MKLCHALPGVLHFGNMASRSVNRVTLIGHLGKDAETRFTPSGVAMSRVTLATSRRWKDKQTGDWKEETDWHTVVIWRQENLAQFLTKGKQIYVEGRLQTRSYDDKDGQKKYSTEVVADEVILLGGKGDGPSGSSDESWGEATQRGPVSMPRAAQGSPAAGPAPAKTEPELGGGISDDDVPF